MGVLPAGPLRLRRGSETLHAAADRGRPGVAVAQPKRPALGVVIAVVPRGVQVAVPRPAARVPHEALDMPGLGHGDPGVGRVSGGDDVAVGDLARADRELEGEQVREGRHLGDAAEPLAVPRPGSVHLGAVAAPQHVLRRPRGGVGDVPEATWGWCMVLQGWSNACHRAVPLFCPCTTRLPDSSRRAPAEGEFVEPEDHTALPEPSSRTRLPEAVITRAPEVSFRGWSRLATQ